MIPIKIYCGCGQHYAFDVEAVNGRMPTAVACPTCGVDGTEAANAIIAQTLMPPAAVAAPVAEPGLRVSRSPGDQCAVPAAPAPTVPSTPRGMASFMPKVERPQAEHEAKAKVFWGDAPEDVTKFLMLHGFSVEEATALVTTMYKERLSTIRSNGMKKIMIGVALMLVPVIALVIFLSMGFLPLKLFGLTVAVGLWGAWMVLKGTFMMLSPKSERGDVSEQ